MVEAVKIILHCHDTANLPLMARAAEYGLKADMAEGDIKALTYGDGQLPQPVHIGLIKRKTCITIYDQPGAA
jgi:pyruvate/oxaloacetate carboxyltransferase